MVESRDRSCAAVVVAPPLSLRSSPAPAFRSAIPPPIHPPRRGHCSSRVSAIASAMTTATTPAASTSVGIPTPKIPGMSSSRARAMLSSRKALASCATAAACSRAAESRAASSGSGIDRRTHHRRRRERFDLAAHCRSLRPCERLELVANRAHSCRERDKDRIDPIGRSEIRARLVEIVERVE